MSKHNICIIGLNKIVIKAISKQLADDMEMFFADIDDLIEFDLIDVNKAEELCGKEYLLKIEQNKVRIVSGYENVVLTLNYSILNNETNLKEINNNCVLIYLRFNGDIDKNTIMADRDYICSRKAEIVVECENLDINMILNKIKLELKRYFDGK